MESGTSNRSANESGWLDFGHELVIDLFAGGGGASAGLKAAYREPDIAVNHNAIAIAVHRANHPKTKHFTCDVFEVDPVATTGGRPVGVLWASPDCRHHSKAKGGKPRSKKIRGLAWVIVKWAAACKPRLLHLENVEEFADWGPLMPDGSPCKAKKGMTFRRWKKQLENLGYVVEHRELIAADYDTPTIRKRLYVIARCDGQPIQWPAPTHHRTGANGLPKWREAAECIDFGLPACSIFATPQQAKDFAKLQGHSHAPKRPLVANTLRRVAKGLWRHVLNSANPYIVPLRGTSAAHTSTHPVTDPVSTVTGAGTHHALVQPQLAPFLTEHANSSTQRTFSAAEPLRTQCAQVKGGHFAVVSPVLVGCGGRMGQSPPRHVEDPVQTITSKADACVAGATLVAVSPTLLTIGYGERKGQAPRAQDPNEPLGTVVGTNKHAIAAAHLAKFRFDSAGSDLHSPMHTVTAGGAMARPAGAAHALGLVGSVMIQAAHGEGRPGGVQRWGHGSTTVSEPVRTITAAGGHAVAAVHLTHLTHQGDRSGCDAAEPMRTVTGAHRGEQALVSAFLEQANGGFYDGDGRSLEQPASTILQAGSQQRLVNAYLVKYYREGGQLQAADEPMHTVPTKDRMGLVQVVQVSPDTLAPEHRQRAKQCADLLHEYLPEHFPTPCEMVLVGDYVLVDITLRMLVPRELARAQGFPDDYIIERGLFEDVDTGDLVWKDISRTDQVRLIGNSVCWRVAKALVEANCRSLNDFYRQQAA
jgi:DNA (cytosine-5)-methyltransferase 1